MVATIGWQVPTSKSILMINRYQFHLLGWIASSLVALCASCVPENAWAQDQRLYWTVRLTPTGLVYRSAEYGVPETDTVNLDGLEVFPDAIGTDPINVLYWERPDFKRVLLRQGLARLREGAPAEVTHVAAQDSARVEGRGWWVRSLPAQADGGGAADSLASSDSLASTGGIDEVGTPRQRDFSWIWKGLVAAVTAFGGYGLSQILWTWFHRHKVRLILLGEPATGKSWFWHRMINPQISEFDLGEAHRNQGVGVASAEYMRVSKYTLVPEFIDVPGRQTGEQLSQLIDKRRFRFIRLLLSPQKRIWIIFLSPSRNGTAADPEAIDSVYVGEQLGYLSLPEGVLASPKTSKPNMVIMCITKFDLFSEHHPNDSASGKAKATVKNIFQKHISRIQEECKAKRVPFATVVTSARRGWGIESVERYIKTALYHTRP